MAAIPTFSESPISPATQRNTSSAPAPVRPKPSKDSTLLLYDQNIDDRILSPISDHAVEGGSVAVSAGKAKLQEAVASPMNIGDGLQLPATLRPQTPGSSSPSTVRSRTVSLQRDIPRPPRDGVFCQQHQSAVPPEVEAMPTVSLMAPLRSASISRRTSRKRKTNLHRVDLLSPMTPSDRRLQTPKSAPVPQKSLEHPPGYIQNPYAAEQTKDQHIAIHHKNASPALGYDGSPQQGFLGLRSPASLFNFGALLSPTSRRDDALPGATKHGGEAVWSVVGSRVQGVGKKVEGALTPLSSC